MIIQYYADSLGLSRPGHVTLSQRYIYLFEKWLRQNYNEEIFIINRSKGGVTVTDLFDQYKQDEEYLSEEQDLLIVNVGICDCAPRPIPPRIRKLISILPDFIRIRLVALIHKNRSRLLKNGFVYYRTDKLLFEDTLKSWMVNALSSFKAIYLFNIAPTNDNMENHSPGLKKGINQYNDILKKVVDVLSDPKIKLIDINAVLINSENLDEFIIKEDGHHITVKAHYIYVSELIKLEKQRLLDLDNDR